MLLWQLHGGALLPLRLLRMLLFGILILELLFPGLTLPGLVLPGVHLLAFALPKQKLLISLLQFRKMFSETGYSLLRRGSDRFLPQTC